MLPESASSPRYPGLSSIQNGSGAVVWVETHVTQAACAYPITPSTNMGTAYAEVIANGGRNLWGEPLVFLEPESEHSSASAAEGFALTGGRVTNFTALNVHAGHDDVMAVADTGWGMLFARNVQAAGDLCLIARRAAEASYTPFMNVQDGFLTTHTLETVRLPEPELMEKFVGSPAAHLINLMDPAHPIQSGVVQNPDA